MANKWLIVDGEFRISAGVNFHKEFLLRHENVSNTQGGGWWYLDRGTKTLYLYSSSDDFGAAKKEDVLSAIKEREFPPYMKGFSVFISTKSWFNGAIEEAVGRDPDYVIQ